MVFTKYKLKIEFIDPFFFKYFLFLKKWLKSYKVFCSFVKKKKRNIITILKSPHVNKKAMEQLRVIEKKLYFFYYNKVQFMFFWRFYNFFFFFFTKFARSVFYKKLGIFYF